MAVKPMWAELYSKFNCKTRDKDFVLRWTNLPYLVNTKTQMTVKANELFKDGKKEDFVVWDAKTNQPPEFYSLRLHKIPGSPV